MASTGIQRVKNSLRKYILYVNDNPGSLDLKSKTHLKLLIEFWNNTHKIPAQKIFTDSDGRKFIDTRRDPFIIISKMNDRIINNDEMSKNLFKEYCLMESIHRLERSRGPSFEDKDSLSKYEQQIVRQNNNLFARVERWVRNHTHEVFMMCLLAMLIITMHPLYKMSRIDQNSSQPSVEM